MMWNSTNDSTFGLGTFYLPVTENLLTTFLPSSHPHISFHRNKLVSQSDSSPWRYLHTPLLIFRYFINKSHITLISSWLLAVGRSELILNRDREREGGREEERFKKHCIAFWTCEFLFIWKIHCCRLPLEYFYLIFLLNIMCSWGRFISFHFFSDQCGRFYRINMSHVPFHISLSRFCSLLT